MQEERRHGRHGGEFIVVDFAFTVNDGQIADVMSTLQERVGPGSTAYVVSLSPGHAEHLLSEVVASGHAVTDAVRRWLHEHPAARVVLALDPAAAAA